MSIHIYNSLTSKKEEFLPLNPPQVNIYTCGVTVYDESHIGHARSLYIFDVIRRYLKYRGFQVNFVRNITDIDDKIINRANELKTDWRELVRKYIDSYYEDLERLGIDKGDFEPRATENIPEMVKYIQGLVIKGFAYEAGGDVYFSVRKFPEYGKLSGQSIDQMETGVRIDPTEHKKDPLDFALWKKSKENEPSWDSPWGRGRPGWHIECSVMSQKYLKTDTLDIHAGGRDLIFPHHENEIAQAESLTGKPFAKYWMHGGLLTINAQKMAKSLDNFITIKDVLKRYNPDILKLFFLSAHYASPIDFSWKKMEQFRSAYDRFAVLFNKIDRKFGARQIMRGRIDTGGSEIHKYKLKFEEAMDDDFNTTQATSVLFELVTLCNKVFDEYDESKEDYMLILSYAIVTIFELGNILGLSFKYIPEDMSDAWVESLIKRRLDFKNKGNFKEADFVRKMLEEKGIILEDSKGGRTTWRRKV
ncbi:MAG: cysteine--tRNA ligase [Candidatus Omnitrophota bacterium]